MMSGLPATPSTRRRRAAWEIVILGGIERLTEELMSGRSMTEDDLSDMRDVRRRLGALDNALAARERAAGLVDDGDEQ